MIEYYTYIINSRTFERIIRNTVNFAIRNVQVYYVSESERKAIQNKAVKNAKRVIAVEDKKANL